MDGFTPAACRVGGVVSKKKQHHRDNNDESNNIHNDHGIKDDNIKSDSSTDFDNPYHETALDWYIRHTRRRDRQLAGMSSSDRSSDSSSDEGSVSSLEGVDDDHFFGGEDEDASVRKKRREMEMAIRSVERPLERWIALYPLVAARCCLASIPVSISTDLSAGANYYHGRGARSYSTPPSPLLPLRVEETKRLRRILRRVRHKQTEFRVKFRNAIAGGMAASTVATPEQTRISNESSMKPQMIAVNKNGVEVTSEDDHIAIHSFLPQGTGISFIDAVLGRESLIQSRQQKSSSRLVLEVNGPTGSGMTSILLAVAARYVASTSQLFFPGMGCEKVSGARVHRPPTKRCKRNKVSAAALIAEPRVVILDVALGVHIAKLVNCVREAVLRRWEETAPARRWKRKHDEEWEVGEAEGINGRTTNGTIER